MTHIPDYIGHRIRRPIPAGAKVVAGSTPVVAFGNSRTATIATLGLNPSRKEFLDDSGNELMGSERRLATLKSLGVSALADAPTKAVEQVLQACDAYFQNKPYWGWFGKLEEVLQHFGASYIDCSACHLDLVQWATDPTWNNLRPAKLKRQLIDADANFLKAQLTNENITLLLVNGSGVADQLCKKLGASLREVDRIDGLWQHRVRLCEGKVFGRVRVISWNPNLQSSPGVSNELILEIAKRVADISRMAIC